MQTIDAFIAANRFGLGPAPGRAGGPGADPRGWVRAQTRPAMVPAPALARHPASAEILAAIHGAPRGDGGKARRDVIRRAYKRHFGPELLDRARHMIASERPFGERMVLFWSNHFTVSRSRGRIGPAAPAFEREAIRPHVFGRFADMLRAVVQHPVMLGYLDNTASVGPNSRFGQRRSARGAGRDSLNENLAREILELHTLGVRGGYDQADVVELAKALTGWADGGLRRREGRVHGGFQFYPALHEPGPREVLGRRYPQEGQAQGLAILDDLARHPATARHIATKLARHMIADDPPEGAVARLAAVFQETDGDLGALSRELVAIDALWEAPAPKVKTPYELVISAHRATGVMDPPPRDILQALSEMNQVPFTAPSPKGWGDRAQDWISPEGLMRRIEWLRRYAASLPAATAGPDPRQDPERFLETVIGPVASEETRLWTARAPSPDAGVAMVLASPEFQRR